MSSIITLTTDFGIADEYVGVMKGVILSRTPQATIIDLTHQIAPQDIRQTAYCIHSAHTYFPAGTIHVVVVDPGVGTKRKIVVVRAADQFFVAPDNGVLSLILSDHSNEITAYEITAEDLYLKPVSHTFHGRDIMAPVAAELATGIQPQALGGKLKLHELVTLNLPQMAIDHLSGTITGAVVHIDHFGNATTNITSDALKRILGSPQHPGGIMIRVKKHTISGLTTSYGNAALGAPLVLIGSRDYLEIGINGGNASELLDISIDDKVLVQRV